MGVRGGLGRFVSAGASTVALLTLGACTSAESNVLASAPVVEPAPADAAPPSAPLAPPDLPSGVYEQRVIVDGHPRRWTTVVPARADDGSPPAGVVIVLHGVGGSGRGMRSTGFDPLALVAGMVMVYPDGLGAAWNDGRPGLDPVVPGVAVDDVRFLRLLIDETVTQTGADARRVAIVGFSNGGVMAARVACELSDRVSAIAVVAGSAGHGFQQSCRPAHPVSVMVVAGANDPTVPYTGGKVASFGALSRGLVAPVDELFSFWAAADGCASTATTVSGNVNEARGVECRLAPSVVRYRVGGGGHEWFRAPRFDTTGAIWSFVTRRFATAA
jgi:polyhydroxybutyrate depolymerase